KMYTTCTTQDETRPWCATTYNYDVDKQWGYCGGDAPGSVPQAKISYAPCPSDCDGKCVDTCPDYCCVKNFKSKTSQQIQQPAAPQPSQNQLVSPVQPTSSSCPPICATVCAPDCPVHCCNLPPPSPYVPSPPSGPVYCQPICLRVCYNTCPAECCSNTQPGMARDTSSYTVSLPCPADCHPICHDNCPAQCCQKAHQASRRLPFVDDYSPSPSSLTVRSKMDCPVNCRKFCSQWCPRHCCSKKDDGKATASTWHQDISSQVCKDGAATVGGNARGACCKFPFIYKGTVYWRCTAQDADKKWCSVTKVFNLDRKWGYCT
ncbi:hypothetical protein ACROYT_G003389, partial [Oculina patagonica]